MRNPELVSGDLNIIKKSMTPTEYKGFLKGRILELRLLCSEPNVDIESITKLIALYQVELDLMNPKTKKDLKDKLDEMNDDLDADVDVEKIYEQKVAEKATEAQQTEEENKF